MSKNFMYYIIGAITVDRFHFLHSLVFNKNEFYAKTLTFFWKYIQIKKMPPLALEIFAYVISYL